jgi:hypothetical protein
MGQQLNMGSKVNNLSESDYIVYVNLFINLNRTYILFNNYCYKVNI